jgi:hypothetical protein
MQNLVREKQWRGNKFTLDDDFQARRRSGRRRTLSARRLATHAGEAMALRSNSA